MIVARVPQPILRTDRLILLPLADHHFDLEVELDSDPEVLKYIVGRARTRDEVAVSHRRRMGLAAPVDGLGFWMAFAEPGGDFVGLMMLPPAEGVDQPHDRTAAELGYRLLRRQWRKGYASEAARVLLRHAFQTVRLRRVIAQTMAVNTGSRAVMETIGMRYVRTFFPSWEDPLPGTEHGEVEYEISRELWLASHPGPNVDFRTVR